MLGDRWSNVPPEVLLGIQEIISYLADQFIAGEERPAEVIRHTLIVADFFGIARL